jgi:hypothetical protein
MGSQRHFVREVSLTRSFHHSRLYSPINDLLDKGEFTLENLLKEDELIQEVKSKNERLLEL